MLTFVHRGSTAVTFDNLVVLLAGTQDIANITHQPHPNSYVGLELERILTKLLLSLCSILSLHDVLGSLHIQQIGFCHTGTLTLCLDTSALCFFIVVWWSGSDGE